MLKIGLTGGIATGKSTVAKYFSELNVPVINSDMIVSSLYKKKEIKYKIKKLFGTSDKKKIASVIFSNPAKRKRLEKLLHPKVINYFPCQPWLSPHF